MPWPFRWRRTGDALLIAAVAAVDLIQWNWDNEMRGGGEMPLWGVPTVAVAVYCTLLFRWQRPLEVFIVQWAYTVIGGLVLPFYDPFAGLLFGLHAVGRRSSPRVAKAALAACILPLGINSYNVASVQQGGLLINLIFASLIWVSLALLVWGLARNAYTADWRAEQLRQAEAAAAVRAERLRLARELHDTVSHAVS